MKPFSIRIDQPGETAHIVFEGELDIATSPGAEAELKRVEADGGSLIVLDLRGLTFMDSTGLRLLVAADARARDAGHRLAIVKGPEAVHRVLEITGLDAKLDLIADPADAAPAT